MTENTQLPPEVEESKVIAMLSYLGILFLVPLLSQKENKFCQHHAKQGMVLFGAAVIGAVVLAIADIILGMVPCAGMIIIIILWVGYLGLLAFLVITGIIKTLQGEYWKMPVLGGFAEQIKI